MRVTGDKLVLKVRVDDNGKQTSDNIVLNMEDIITYSIETIYNHNDGVLNIQYYNKDGDIIDVSHYAQDILTVEKHLDEVFDRYGFIVSINGGRDKSEYN